MQTWRNVLATALCAAACSQPGMAQVAPPTILEIESENQVEYIEDIADVSKFATDPKATTACYAASGRVECAGQHLTFHSLIFFADVVAVNGQPAKGTSVVHGLRIQANPTPSPGQAVADITRN